MVSYLSFFELIIERILTIPTVRDAAREAMDFRSHLSTARQDSDTAESAWGVVDVSDNESADD